MLHRSRDFMDCALTLAKLALGYTSPNPAVGAVIVKEGVIVGLGHTQLPGSAHAEVVALQQAGERAKGAAMYVTLEPCPHYGRTPPCTQAIINAGISEVHAAVLDPNPVVSGRGIEELERVNIKTYVGECQKEAEEVNEAYTKYITTGMPFVTAKFAMSLDGKIAARSGDSQWITGEEARKYVHNLRHIVDAIMVGVNTVLADNPHLTARSSGGKGGRTKLQPLRVIVDGKGRTPITAEIFKEPGKTLLAVTSHLDPAKIETLSQVADVLELPDKEGLVDLEALFKALGRRGITSVLVEGGGGIFGSLFDAELVDKVLAFISPMIIGGKEAKTPVAGEGREKVVEALSLHCVKVERFGDDVLVCGYAKKS